MARRTRQNIERLTIEKGELKGTSTTFTITGSCNYDTRTIKEAITYIVTTEEKSHLWVYRHDVNGDHPLTTAHN